MADEITNTTEQVTGQAAQTDVEEPGGGTAAEVPADSAEVARLKAELAKANAAKDKAMSETAEYKRRERAQMSEADRIKEEAAEKQAAIEKELADLRREKAVSNSSKKAFMFLQDENSANAVAEYLYGAEDVDAALDVFQKAWTAREKALRLEYGKIPAPGVGAGDKALTREDIMKIKDPEERQKAIAANMGLF